MSTIDFSGADGFDAKLAKLVAALDTDLDWKQDHTRLLTRAKEWEGEGKDRSFLLRGRDLREAEQWVAKSTEKEPKPTTLHSRYILASRQSATKLQRIIISPLGDKCGVISSKPVSGPHVKCRSATGSDSSEEH